MANSADRGYVLPSMNNVAGLAIFALGIVLLIFGFTAAHSLASGVSGAFSGTPTDRYLWMIVGGALAIAAGLTLALRGGPDR